MGFVYKSIAQSHFCQPTRKGENCFRSYSVLELCVCELEFDRLAFLLLLSALVKDFYCTTQMRNRD